MGGNASVTAAGAFPDRFAAIASFHGGNLGTDKPDSPHLFVRNISGRVYVAGAIEDASFPEEQKIRLEKALTEAGREPCGRDLFRRTPRLCSSGFASL